MTFSGRIGRWLALSALLATLVPLVWFFPGSVFGFQLTNASVLHFCYELVFYATVTYLMYRRGSLSQLIQAAGLVLVCRLCLGAAFGFLVVVMYNINLTVAMSLGLASYLPALLLHVLAAPLVAKPLVDQIVGPARKKSRLVIHPVEQPVESEAAPAATPTESGPEPPSVEQPPAEVSAAAAKVAPPAVDVSPAPPRPAESPKPANITGDMSGFERAVRYIGEHGAVFLAAVVDAEGLLLANYGRADLVADDWAPLSLLFLDANQRILERNALGILDRVDLRVEGKRVVTARSGDYIILVVADRQSDDVLNIRIAQAIEMITKYAAERYAVTEEKNAERIYVSGTE